MRIHPQAAQIAERHEVRAGEYGLAGYRDHQMAQMMSMCYPAGSAEVLQVAAAFVLWMVAVDDLHFDERPDLTDAWFPARQTALMVRIVQDPRAPRSDDPLHAVLHHVAAQLRQMASPAQYGRFSSGVVEWLLGQLCSVALPIDVSLDEYRAVRRLAAGIEMFLALIDLADGFTLPDATWRDPAVAAQTRRACDIVALSNDVYSAPKEMQRQENPVNLPSVFMYQHAMGAGEAMEAAAGVVGVLYADFAAADGKLRTTASPELRRYLDGLCAWLAGHHYWAIMSGRYQEEER